MNKYPMVKLGDLFSNKITGEWGKDCNNNGIFVIRTTNFTQNGVINLDNIVLRDIPIKKVKEKRLFSNDIILEKSGGTENTPVGRVVYCDDRINQNTYLCNNFTIALRTNQNIAFSKYVFYFMWFYHKIGAVKLLQNQTTGIRNLQVKSYMNIKIPLPPIKEQRHIAEVLDKVTAQIDNCNKILQNLDLLVKSKFVQMFGNLTINSSNFNTNKLGVLCDVRDGTHNSPKYVLTNGYPLVTSKNIVNNSINLENVNYISKEDFIEINKRSKVNNGDIIMPMIGTIGNPIIVNVDYKFAIKNVSLIKFYSNSVVTNVYILNLLKSNYFEFTIFTNKRGGTQKFISLNDIRNLNVSIPPIELQNQFAEFVENVEKQKTTTQNTLNQLETLKNALMQEYFN